MYFIASQREQLALRAYTLPKCASLGPASGKRITITPTLAEALAMDAGVGVDPATVQMKLDGAVVVAKFLPATGQLSYLPAADLSAGAHTLQVFAQDVVGNASSLSAAWTNNANALYLPLVRR